MKRRRLENAFDTVHFDEVSLRWMHGVILDLYPLWYGFMERGFDQGSGYVIHIRLVSYGPQCIIIKMSRTMLRKVNLKQTAFTVKVDVQLHYSNVGTMVRSEKRAGRQPEHILSCALLAQSTQGDRTH